MKDRNEGRRKERKGGRKDMIRKDVKREEGKEGRKERYDKEE